MGTLDGVRAADTRQTTAMTMRKREQVREAQQTTRSGSPMKGKGTWLTSERKGKHRYGLKSKTSSRQTTSGCR